MTGDITVTELMQRLDAGENIHIIDVREHGNLRNLTSKENCFSVEIYKVRIDGFRCLDE